ncbi:MAG: hypothetical protein ABJG88_09925 [Litorimonas sp.]
MASSKIDIHAVETRKQVKAFLNLPYTLYKNEPNWRAPLRFERAAQVDPRKNPAAKPITHQFFLAYKDGQLLGRVAAFINASHDAHYNDNAGFFGYLDTVADSEITRALLAAAEEWVKSQGRDKIFGPAQWSVNEECGLLIDGFDTPPAILMPYGRPDYQTSVEEYGFEKVVDLYAYMSDLHAGYPRSRIIQALVGYADKTPSLTWRRLDKSNFVEDIKIAMDIFNDAWSENWGFIPFTPEQILHTAKEMKPIIVHDSFWIGSIDDKPVAYVCMIPDINEVAKGFNGRLLPFNWARFLWRLKVRKVKRLRLPLMGLRREWHNKRKGVALTTKICELAYAGGRDNGYTHCELSWILEDNDGMKAICDQAQAEHYKTYRMYQKSIH